MLKKPDTGIDRRQHTNTVYQHLVAWSLNLHRDPRCITTPEPGTKKEKKTSNVAAKGGKGDSSQFLILLLKVTPVGPGGTGQ